MKLEKLTLNDYDQIKELSKKCGLPFLGKNEWKNIWEKNPFIISSEKDWVMGWKLVDQNSQIVGAIHNIPFVFYFKNEEILAAI
ncbi:hypothetical protein OAJ64_01565, partial [Pelagibacteraceae bacterium]|nr:hypothetical protein [Pelagibacteraceae bacterium]